MKPTSPEFCTCSAIRQAARHVSQYFDQHLAPSGLRITQFSILAKLKARGPLTINSLADVLVMDRTTLGRDILPLTRDGLIGTVQGTVDRRSKELHLIFRSRTPRQGLAILGSGAGRVRCGLRKPWKIRSCGL